MPDPAAADGDGQPGDAHGLDGLDDGADVRGRDGETLLRVRDGAVSDVAVRADLAGSGAVEREGDGDDALDGGDLRGEVLDRRPHSGVVPTPVVDLPHDLVRGGVAHLRKALGEEVGGGLRVRARQGEVAGVGIAGDVRRDGDAGQGEEPGADDEEGVGDRESGDAFHVKYLTFR